MRRILLLGLAVILASAAVAAGAAEVHRTRQLPDGAESPPATLDQVAWIAGHWEGEAFGGIAEEVWSPPRGGSMMCMFRLIVDGKVKFYELVVLREVDASLVLQLKHFNGDLTGWEEKDETVDFPLVAIEDDTAYFAGFTIERVSDDEMTIWVNIEDQGQAQEVPFRYRRVE